MAADGGRRARRGRIFSALEAVTKIFALARRQRFSIAAALSAVGVFQPAMADFVSWPFMIMQLLWLSLLMFALLCVVRIAGGTDPRPWPWLAAASGYASMHVSGLGLVTVAAVMAVFLIRPARKRVFGPLIVLACASAVHAWAMIHFLPARAEAVAAPTVGSVAAIKMLLGFVFNFAAAGLHSFSLTSPASPTVTSIAYCWPLGVLLITLIAFGIYKRVRPVDELTPANIAVTSVLIFSAAGFFTLVLLIAAREMAEASVPGRFVPYFNAFTVMPRYLIPVHYLFLAPAAILIACLAKWKPRSISIIGGAAVVAAAITQLEFMAGPMKSLFPATRVSHYSAWRLVLATARECRAVGLPLPNLPLAALTMEFSTADIHEFLPLIRHDLGLGPEQKLELTAWPLSTAATPETYAGVPTLKELEEKLHLLPDGS